MTKTELRECAQAQLKTFLKTHNKQQMDQAISEHLEPFLNQAQCVGSFKSLSMEPNLDFIENKNFVYPKTQNQILKYYKSTQFEKSSFGTLEPIATHADEVEVSRIECILVPGLAFDKTGGRLGRGAGFFDQTLEKYQGVKVGLGYSSQIFAQVPVEAHDVKMNYIVTEKGVLKCQ